MDWFDTHYYWLNRRLLIIVGHWPYQNRAEKIKKWFVFFCAVMLQIVMQGGQVVKSDLSFEHCIEFISESLVPVLVAIRYMSNEVNSGKIKDLLEKIRLTWQSLIKTDEYDIFCESVEEGRLYIIRYAIVMLWLIIPNLLLLLMSPLLMYTPITNVSCPIMMMYAPDYFINPEKYCYPLLLCICYIVVTVLVSLYAIDMMYIAMIYHAIAMFRLVCYRLERAFDERTDEIKFSSNRTYVCERIANAVEWHRASTRLVNWQRQVVFSCCVIIFTYVGTEILHLCMDHWICVWKRFSFVCLSIQYVINFYLYCHATCTAYRLYISTSLMLDLHIPTYMFYQRYCDDIIEAYGWTNFTTLTIGLVGIAITLYWAVMAKGQTIKTMINLTICVGQIFHIYMMYIPAQEMLDTSAEVIFKAYSSLWYMAHVKDQVLILLTMQRGLRPSTINVGGLYEATLENFAAEIKVSFSYFTLLMSL